MIYLTMEEISDEEVPTAATVEFQSTNRLTNVSLGKETMASAPRRLFVEALAERRHPPPAVERGSCVVFRVSESVTKLAELG